MSPTDQLIFFQNHAIHFWIEYAVYPFIVFGLISKIVHKYNRHPDFDGTPFLLELFARNWIELSLTFALSLFLFELRISWSGIPLYSFENNELILNQIRFRALLSYSILLTLFLVCFIIATIKNKDGQNNNRYNEVKIKVIRSFIPITLIAQLSISTLFYYNQTICYILSLTVVISVSFLLYFMRYTYDYWRDVALAMKANQSNITMQLDSLEAFLNAYSTLSFSRKLDIKLSAALECADQLIFITKKYSMSDYHTPTHIKLFHKTMSAMNKCMKYAKKTKHPQLNIIKDCINDLNMINPQLSKSE